MTKSIENPRRLEAEGFLLGQAHRDRETPAPLRVDLWPEEFRQGYEAGRLGEGSRTCLQVMIACHDGLPIADLRGDLTEAEIIDDRGLLTEKGRTLARILLALT